MPVEGGEAGEVFRVAGKREIRCIRWEPDGNALLVFISSPEDEDDGIWRVPLDGGQPIRTGTTAGVAVHWASLDFHPDGSRHRLLLPGRPGARSGPWKAFPGLETGDGHSVLGGAFMVIAGATGLLRSPLHGQLLGQRAVPTGLDLYMPTAEDGLPPRQRCGAGSPSLLRSRSVQRFDHRVCDVPRPPEGIQRRKGGCRGSGWADGGLATRPLSVNRGYGHSFFWDGRAATLEEQVVMPIESAQEMDANLDDVVDRLAPRRLVLGAFSCDPRIRPESRDIGSIPGSLRPHHPVGRFTFRPVMDGDPAALSELEIEGLRLFQGGAGCDNCHRGPNLTDEKFHNTGVAYARWVS